MSNDVCEIYESVVSGEKSLEEGCRKIVEVIFKNPRKFGISDMQEDDQSEFVLYLLLHIQKTVLNYTSGLSSFSTYIIGCIQMLRFAWYRDYYHKKARQESVKQYYIKEEAKLVCEDEIAYETNVYHKSSNNQLNTTQIQVLLILALKSCYYLTPYHIRILASKTGCSEAEIYKMKEFLESSLQGKIKRNTIMKNKINTAYINKNRCAYELMCVKEGGTISERLKTKQDLYSYRWKKYIHDLHNFPKVKPSNEQIAELLNLKVHVVYRILHELKNVNENAVLEYYSFTPME